MLWVCFMLFGEASRLPHDCAWCFSFFYHVNGRKLFTPFPHMSETTTMCYNYIALGDELEQVLIFHIIWPSKLVRDEDKDASHDKLTSTESRKRVICTPVISRNDCKALWSAGWAGGSVKRVANEKEIYLFVRLHVLCFQSFVFLPRWVIATSQSLHSSVALVPTLRCKMEFKMFSDLHSARIQIYCCSGIPTLWVTYRHY